MNSKQGDRVWLGLLAVACLIGSAAVTAEIQVQQRYPTEAQPVKPAASAPAESKPAQPPASRIQSKPVAKPVTQPYKPSAPPPAPPQQPIVIERSGMPEAELTQAEKARRWNQAMQGMQPFRVISPEAHRIHQSMAFRMRSSLPSIDGFEITLDDGGIKRVYSPDTKTDGCSVQSYQDGKKPDTQEYSATISCGTPAQTDNFKALFNDKKVTATFVALSKQGGSWLRSRSVVHKFSFGLSGGSNVDKAPRITARSVTFDTFPPYKPQQKVTIRIELEGRNWHHMTNDDVILVAVLTLDDVGAIIYERHFMQSPVPNRKSYYNLRASDFKKVGPDKAGSSSDVIMTTRVHEVSIDLHDVAAVQNLVIYPVPASPYPFDWGATPGSKAGYWAATLNTGDGSAASPPPTPPFSTIQSSPSLTVQPVSPTKSKIVPPAPPSDNKSIEIVESGMPEAELSKAEEMKRWNEVLREGQPLRVVYPEAYRTVSLEDKDTRLTFVVALRSSEIGSMKITLSDGANTNIGSEDCSTQVSVKQQAGFKSDDSTESAFRVFLNCSYTDKIGKLRGKKVTATLAVCGSGESANACTKPVTHHFSIAGVSLAGIKTAPKGRVESVTFSQPPPYKLGQTVTLSVELEAENWHHLPSDHWIVYSKISPKGSPDDESTVYTDFYSGDFKKVGGSQQNGDALVTRRKLDIVLGPFEKTGHFDLDLRSNEFYEFDWNPVYDCETCWSSQITIE